MASSLIPDVTETGLETLLADTAGGPVVVEFYGARCPACRVVASILEEISRDDETGMRFAKLDIDACMELAGSFGVRSVPLLIVFEGAREVRRLLPARPTRTAIRSFVEGTAQ